MAGMMDDTFKQMLYDAEISLRVAQKRGVAEAKAARTRFFLACLVGYAIGKGSRGR